MITENTDNKAFFLVLKTVKLVSFLKPGSNEDTFPLYRRQFVPQPDG